MRIFEYHSTPNIMDLEEKQAAAAAQFNKGDLVRLKSGGPIMTVASAIGDAVHCTWWREFAAGGYEYAWFSHAMLAAPSPANNPASQP